MADVAVVSFLWGEWPEDRPELGVEYVNRLADSVARNTTVPYDWHNFGSSDLGVPFPDKFGQLRWNLKKMFMFSPQAGLRKYDWVVALDLDMVVTGSLDFLLSHRSDNLVTCCGAYVSQNPGGSVVAFRPNRPWTDSLVDRLLTDTEEVERVTRGSERRYYHMLNEEPGWGGQVIYWQEMYPGKILSYKVDGYRKGASIVRFHGKPRPHQVADKWVKEFWR